MFCSIHSKWTTQGFLVSSCATVNTTQNIPSPPPPPKKTLSPHLDATFAPIPSHSLLIYFLKGKVLAQGPQDQVLRPREFVCPRGREGRNKGQRQATEDKAEGGGNKEKGQGCLSCGTKDCLCIEKRQTCPISKWWFIKAKNGKPH